MADKAYPPLKDIFWAVVGFISVPIMVIAAPFAAIWYAIHVFLTSDKMQEKRAREKTYALYEETCARLSDVSFPQADDFAVSCVTPLIKSGKDTACAPLMISFYHVAEALYEAENFPVLAIPKPPPICNSIEGGRYRDLLQSLAVKASSAASPEVARQALIKSFSDFSELLPPLARQSSKEVLEGFEDEQLEASQSILGVSLLDALPNVGEAVQRLILPLYTEEARAARVFVSLREQLDRNLHEASNIPFTFENRDSPKLVMPFEYKGAPQDIVASYLRHTPFTQIFDRYLPFVIPEQIRFEHMWVVSPQGGGKTQTYQSMILDDLEKVARNEASVVIIDSQGDLIRNVSELKAFGKGGKLEGKLLLIEPDIENPIALNPFAMAKVNATSERENEELANSALDLLLYVFSGLLETEMTPKQETLFRYVIRACMAIPNANILTFGKLLQDASPFQASINTLPPPARDFFETQYDGQFKKTREEVGWRLSYMLESTTFARMFSAPDNKFDFYNELASSKVIVINTDKQRLKDRSAMFGRFFIAMLLHASERRASLPRAKRLPVYCYIDEFGDYASDTRVAKILDQARKMNIGMILANQRLSQITAPGLLDALQNCSIKFARDANDSDASALARNMNTTPQFIRSQPKGHFAASLRGAAVNAISVRVPFGVMERREKMSQGEHQALRAAMRARYAVQNPPVKHGVNKPMPEKLAAADPDKGSHTKPSSDW